MRGTKTLLTVIASAILGSTAVAAVPATASAGTEDCPRGSFCAWRYTGYRGDIFRASGDDMYWGNNWINNRDSSWFNNGISEPGNRDIVAVYTGYYEFGDYFCLDPGEKMSSSTKFDNRGSSHGWYTWC